MILNDLIKLEKVNPPNFVISNTVYLTEVGSHSYGVATNESDWDLYGICIPSKEVIFPHLAGEIMGFGRQKNRFEQWTEQHIVHKEKEYDFTIYNIVKYFQLCMDGNPNMVDSLFTPRECVVHSTKVGEMIRDSRELFLHKGCWHKFRGYAYAQLSALEKQKENPKRKESVKNFGYDVKFAYHTVRLLDEIEQILVYRHIDLRRAKDMLRSIRNGEWKKEDIYSWFKEKELYLEKLYHESTIPYSPDEPEIKKILLSCLEEHYGNLDSVIKIPQREEELLKSIAQLTKEYL